MLEDLKQAVLEANLELPRAGLVALTWGTLGPGPSHRLHRDKAVRCPYSTMKADDMVVVGPDGHIVEGGLRPSTDTPTHLVLYQSLEGIGGVVHTHSTWATAWPRPTAPSPYWAPLTPDLSHMEVPVTAPLSAEQVQGDYEIATGHAVVAAVAGRRPAEVPAVLVSGHGTFCWGPAPGKGGGDRRFARGGSQDGVADSRPEPFGGTTGSPHYRAPFLAQARSGRLLRPKLNGYGGTSMKAARLSGPGVIAVVDEPRPERRARRKPGTGRRGRPVRFGPPLVRRGGHR